MTNKQTHAERARARLAARRQDKIDRTCVCGFIGKTHAGLSIHQNHCQQFQALSRLAESAAKVIDAQTS